MRYNGGFLSCYQSFRFVNQLTPLARKHGYIGAGPANEIESTKGWVNGLGCEMGSRQLHDGSKGLQS
ncbi:hypothetical protein YC2023_006039 [Brassica napus]